MRLTPGKLWGMRRMADEAGLFKMLAVDQRPAIIRPMAEKLGLAEPPWAEVAKFKTLLVEVLQEGATALLLDPGYAVPMALDIVNPQKGLVVTLEDSGFRETGGGERLSAAIEGWSVDKTRRLGGDAVKALIWYRPDASASVRQAQQDMARRIGEACAAADIPFLLELLVYPLAGDADDGDAAPGLAGRRADQVLRSVGDFAAADFGVDVFKLESPVAPEAADGSAAVQALFDEMGRIAGRPWVVLSAGAGREAFRAVLTHACVAGASGYLAGRAIWLEALSAYPSWDRMHGLLREVSVPYMEDLNRLADAAAHPWHDHDCYGPQGPRTLPQGPEFPAAYGTTG